MTKENPNHNGLHQHVLVRLAKLTRTDTRKAGEEMGVFMGTSHPVQVSVLTQGRTSPQT